jgi:secreted trypsin-like serine protease
MERGGRTLSMKILFILLTLIASTLTHKNGRIAGGNYADYGDFGHHVHLQGNLINFSKFPNLKNNFFPVYNNNVFTICGGSLIRHNWITTVAHRVISFVYIQAYIGLIDRNEGPLTHSVRIEKKDHVYVHPDYEDFANDIALIYLESAEPDWLEHPWVDLIPLPFANDSSIDLVGKIGTATGFGLTSDEPGSVASYKLKYVEMPVISNQECINYFGEFIIDSKICTSTISGSTCGGDEGAGLIAEIESGRKVLIGIGSFRSGVGCTQVNEVNYFFKNFFKGFN